MNELLLAFLVVTTPVGSNVSNWQMVMLIHARKNDGCITITRRGGHELSLSECNKLSRQAGKDPLWHNGIILSPVVQEGDAWVLLRNKNTKGLRWELVRKPRPANL